MIKDFKTSLKHLWKNKLFSIINILGLSLGLVSCTLILLHVKFELSYDQFHLKKDRIARVIANDFPFTPYLLAPALYEYCPEIEKLSRVTKSGEGKFFIKQNEIFTAEKDLVFADSCFFSVFSFPVLYGDPEKMLHSADRLTISEKSAYKYFGRENPLGNLITLRIDNTNYDFTVEGVFKDFPEQSHFHASFILSMEFWVEHRHPSTLTNWGNWSILTYILMKKPDMFKRINDKMPGLIVRYVPEDRAKEMNMKFRLQPLSKIHLYSKDLIMDIEPQGSIIRVILFASIAVLVLVIALVNFVLLSMALSFQRVREFGIRKMLGAQRRQLVSLITAEFLIVFALSLLIALILLELTKPFVENHMNLNLSQGFMINLGTICSFLVLVVFLGYLASVYIAIYVSRFRPVDAIKNTIPVSNLRLPSRGVLVIFQFSIMICLMSCLICMKKQLYLLHNKDLGFRKEQLVVINIPRDSYNKYIRLKDELGKLHSVTNVSGAAYIPPSNQWWMFDLKDPISGESFQFEEINADYDFIETLQIEILQGRSFSHDFGKDSMAILINETGLKKLGMKKPLDSYLTGPDYYPSRSRMMIIGVFRDYHARSLYEEIYPMAIFLSPTMTREMAVRLAPESLDNIMGLIQEKWISVFPDDPMQFSFVDEGMRLKYIKEDQTYAMISMFTFLSLVIALMGLFGLSVFVIERRIKEIGIRKVHGSKNIDIIYLLSKQFSIWIGIAFVIALPVAWYAMHRWLLHFSYKTELSWWIFALSGFISICIAFMTIFWQSFMAVLRNPVESLRYE
jgi:putative ABC transport system permease protein